MLQNIRHKGTFLFLLLTLFFSAQALPLYAAPNFSLETMSEGQPHEPTILIVGGIQGDEPGGFSAAALLSTRYTFSGATVLIVPNLNFPSIIERSRGLHGDMNRKFAALSEKDPEFSTVRRIQEIITLPEVDIVLNLHDGYGFYRPTHENESRNPKRWGQSIIIDEASWPTKSFQQLDKIALFVTENVNKKLLDPKHAFFVRNTHTSKGETEMEKTLTWFALNHEKAAFGLEVSKDFDVSTRTYYHLLMVESFLDYTGVTYKRSFPLSPAGVRKALSSHIYVGFLDNRITLPLENIRPKQAGVLPLPKGGEEAIDATSPIIAALSAKNTLSIHYGNNTVTSFKTETLEMDTSLQSVHVLIDGIRQEVRFGAMVQVKDHFLVEPVDGYRINAIGADLRKGCESNLKISRKDFLEKYSLDTTGNSYRVEVYKDKKFAGMFVVNYGPASMRTVFTPLPAIRGVESELGF